MKSAVLLALARAGLSLLSLRHCRQAVARVMAISPARCSTPADVLSRRVEWAIFKASVIVPGARHCLTQALAAQVLMARQGQATQLRIGVAKDEAGQLKAHAWLEIEGVPIFGIPNSGLGEYQLLPYLDRT